MKKSNMTTEEKGYECPNFEDCTDCIYYKTLCIVYSKEGKQKYKNWLEKELNN